MSVSVERKGNEATLKFTIPVEEVAKVSKEPLPVSTNRSQFLASEKERLRAGSWKPMSVRMHQGRSVPDPCQ